MGTALLAPLMLASAALPAADARAVNAAVATIYRPFAAPDSMNASWEYPVFSADTARLIGEWRKVVPEDEVDDLNDGDWFCQCQDWLDLRASVIGRRLVRPGVVSARVRIDLGGGQRRAADLVFVKERQRWMLDDMFAHSFPKGLKQALRETAAADRLLKR